MNGHLLKCTCMNFPSQILLSNTVTTVCFLQHAQGAMQGDAAGNGDLQALFDTSALVLGISLVQQDPQVEN